MANYVKITGIDELMYEIKLRKNLDLVQAVVKQNGSELERKMKRFADFKGHYEGKEFVPPTGTTKRSIGLHLVDAGLTAEVYPTTEYSMYLEYGTRFMSAQPFVRPALNAQKPIFLRDMNKIMK